ncbi:uncharacterized protein LOC144914395 [Branchiostoma floridae x Branchiostoma belcheri]
MYGTTDLCDPPNQEDMLGGRRLKPSTSAPLRKRRVSMPAYLPVYKPAVASREDKLQSIGEGVEFSPEEQQDDPSLPRFRRFSIIVPPTTTTSTGRPEPQRSRRASVSENSRLLRGSAKDTERASALQPILFVVVLVVAVVLVSTACSRLFRRLY